MIEALMKIKERAEQNTSYFLFFLPAFVTRAGLIIFSLMGTSLAIQNTLRVLSTHDELEHKARD